MKITQETTGNIIIIPIIYISMMRPNFRTCLSHFLKVEHIIIIRPPKFAIQFVLSSYKPN